MNNLVKEQFIESTIKKFTIPKLKAFIKEKQLVKLKRCKVKQDYIDCILENTNYIFGGEKPKKIVKKIIIKKTIGDKPKKIIIKKTVGDKPKKKLFIKPLLKPKTVCYDKSKVIAGVDEAGAGSMSHGVFVAAVILPVECPTPDNIEKLTMWNSIVDSKKYSSNKEKLHALCEYVKEVALSWSLIVIDEKEIDEINIREARLQGFHRALDDLKVDFNHILIDGDICYNYYKNEQQIKHDCIKQGDAKYRSIAAASLIAKSERDRFMIQEHKKFPMYKWNENFGYAGGKGETHINLIKKYGITKYHRKTFGICKQWRTLPQGNLKEEDKTDIKTYNEQLTECLFSDED
jgi:ribonuclease HII